MGWYQQLENVSGRQFRHQVTSWASFIATESPVGHPKWWFRCGITPKMALITPKSSQNGQYSPGQIITTSAEVTLNGGLVRESPQNPLNSGLGIILICPVSYSALIRGWSVSSQNLGSSLEPAGRVVAHQTKGKGLNSGLGIIVICPDPRNL